MYLRPEETRWETVGYPLITSVDISKASRSLKRMGYVITRSKTMVAHTDQKPRVLKLGRTFRDYADARGYIDHSLIDFDKTVKRVLGSIDNSLSNDGIPMSMESIKDTMSLANVTSGDVVLEIGCGTYPRLALCAAHLTGSLTLSTDFPDTLNHVKTIVEITGNALKRTTS
jgi:hypothetical protein